MLKLEILKTQEVLSSLFMDSLSEICPICLDPIQGAGPHQICSLSCGHLCGSNCLNEWFEKAEGSKTCPKCRKELDPGQTRKIEWDGHLPLETAEIDNIREINKTLRFQNQTLENDIRKLKREINIMQFESEKSSIYSSKTPPTVEKRQVLRPSLVFEQQVKSGAHVCITQKHVIATMQGSDGKYGIKFYDQQNFSESHFLPIHSQQIREIAPSLLDSLVVATVSNDCQIVQTSLRTEQAISQVSLQMPLWSCEWVRPNCVAAGGTNGRFFVVDGRGDVPVSVTIDSGPPVTSIIRIDDDFCYAVTPKKGVLFDIRASGFTKCYIEGFNAGRTCNGQIQFVVSLTRNGTGATLKLHKFGKNRNLNEIDMISISDYPVLAKPSACSVNGNMYVIVPDNNSFSLYSTNSKDPKLSTDFWEKWKSRFCKKDFSPIIDVAIGKSSDLFVASISDKLLQVYAIPT